MTGDVRLDLVDRIARLTISRTEARGAMSETMWHQMRGHLEVVDQTPDVAGVVLQGEGGSFCAGADLAEVRGPDLRDVASYRASAEATVRTLMELQPPKIALIDGPCIGAGCSLALACDVRICSPRSQFAIPALANGLVYEATFVQRLVRIVGPGPAGLLLYGGEQWGAEDALAHGLVDRCSPDLASAGDALAAALQVADKSAIAATATAIRATR